MDISATNRADVSLNAPAHVAPVDKNAEHRQVVQAIRAVNRTEMFGPENELQFERDPQTKKMVVRMVNRQTREVTSQVPAEYLLRLAADLGKRG